MILNGTGISNVQFAQICRHIVCNNTLKALYLMSKSVRMDTKTGDVSLIMMHAVYVD